MADLYLIYSGVETAYSGEYDFDWNGYDDSPDIIPDDDTLGTASETGDGIFAPLQWFWPLPKPDAIRIGKPIGGTKPAPKAPAKPRIKAKKKVQVSGS